MKSSVTIRHPNLSDQREFLAAARASRTLHHPWLVPPSTPAQFRAFVERMERPENFSFLVCRKDTGKTAGVINVTNIVLGTFRSAYLGYYAFSGHEGQGFLRDGLQSVVRHAFTTLKLHRLEANIQPQNIRSIELAKACGFLQEGYSPRYLKIGNRWRDHERWAIVSS